MQDNYVHCHVHSHYSLMDGLDSPTELVKAAVEKGQTALSITDHGSLAGHRELYRACKEHGIKPIFGMEAYYSITDRFDKRAKVKRQDGTDVYNHLILLAKNDNGYRNLNKLSEIAWTEGYYYKPRIDKEVLFDHAEDLIVLTGCLSGVPAKLIDADRYDEAVEWLSEFKEVFGDDLYVELQGHNPDNITNGLIKLAKQVNVPTVVTSDCHRAHEEDRDLQDAFLVAATSPSKAKGVKYDNVRDMSLLEAVDTIYPDRTMSFKDFNLFIQSGEQVAEDFDFDVSASIERTQEIAGKVQDYTYYENLDALPVVATDPDDELETLCLQAMHERGIKEPKYHARLQEELRVIKAKNFSQYFLVLEDIITHALSQNILIGPGRGSAVGSLVCYLLNITRIDPIEHDLLFARFINEERNDMPDVDVDVEIGRRHELKEYARQKFGYSSNIITYGHFSDKSALKAAAKVLAVPYKTSNELTKKVENFKDYDSSTDKFVKNFRNKYPLVRQLAGRLVGRISQSGMHAGGVIISEFPISDYAPIETKEDSDTGERVPVVSLDMNEIESLGFIKYDFLGNRSLDVVRKSGEQVGMTLEDVYNIDIHDKESIRQFDKANTTGTFQFDTVPNKKLLDSYPIRNFHDLAVASALGRPGAMNTIGVDYIKRANGKEPVSTVHPVMDEITKDTLGCVVFQEQVMRTAVELAGMSLSEADHLRKIIGKKQDPAKFAKYKQRFMDGATKKVSEQQAAKLWSDFEAHAGYSFNASHAVSYTAVSVWTMWFRLNHPQVYMTELLKVQPNKEARSGLLVELEDMGIKLYYPDINKSDKSLSLHEDGIRMGLSDIKYISDKSYNNICKYRPYRNLEDLYEASNTKYSGIGSNQVEALLVTGATESIGGPKAKAHKLYEYLGLPIFQYAEGVDPDKITLTKDFSENGVYVLAGSVQKVKRNKNWTLIDLIDESGTVGFFDEGGSGVKKGEFYYFLVADNRVVDFLTADEFELAETALTDYLRNDTMSLLGNRNRYVVKVVPGRTKAGKPKAQVITAGVHDMYNYQVYSNNYSQVVPRIEEGQSRDFKISTTSWGATVVKDVR